MNNLYEEAQLIANIFKCRVAIVRNDNDGPGRHWEAIAESNAGGFPSAAGFKIQDIVNPAKEAASSPAS